MRISCQLVPALALAALAACNGSPTTATIDVATRPGWDGTAEVLVHRADGSMVSRAPITATTDVPIDDGDSITVALQHSLGGSPVSNLVTYTSVDRGDTIHVVLAPAITFRSVPLGLPSVSGADTWSASTPNSEMTTQVGAPTPTIDVPDTATSIPIIAVATAGTTPVALYGERAAPIGANGIVLSDALAWSPTTVTVTGAIGTNPPAIGGGVDLGTDYLGIFPGGDVVPMPTSFGDRDEIAASSGSGAVLASAGEVWSGAPPPAVSLDVSTPSLPVTSGGQLTASSASWTATGGGAFDVVLVDLFHFDSTSNGIYTWNLAAPPGTTAIALPALPSDLASPAPYESSGVASMDLSDLDGYHAYIGGLDQLPPAGERWQYRADDLVPPPPGGAVPSRPRLDRGKLDLRAALAALRR